MTFSCDIWRKVNSGDLSFTYNVYKDDVDCFHEHEPIVVTTEFDSKTGCPIRCMADKWPKYVLISIDLIENHDPIFMEIKGDVVRFLYDNSMAIYHLNKRFSRYWCIQKESIIDTSKDTSKKKESSRRGWMMRLLPYRR